ncbi:MAG: MFS transporter [Opitutaceae bacterium]
MNLIPKFLRPVPDLTDAARERGLRNMTLQAVAASGADGLASGGFLAAFALILGATNFQIGVMTAIPSIVQPLQLLAVVLVERVRMRKLITVTAYFIAYAMWIPVALIPFFIEVPNPTAITVMLFFIALRGMANAFVSTGWNGWLRDIIPQDVMGKFFAHRLRLATIASVIAAILAAGYIDWWKESGPTAEIFGYSYAMLAGSVLFGFAAVAFMARMPEPQMAVPDGPPPSVLHSLSAPWRDTNFRQLIKFTFMWNFVANLAVPFFSVYMLVKLNMSLSAVVGLGVLSQVFNIFFLRVWGPIVDRFGSKIVLTLSSSLYFLVILGWTFTTMPEAYALTFPLLVFLHMLIGIASAGINITTTTIRMKMAPAAQATSYLTVVALSASLGAGIGPLLGGACADFFDVRHLRVLVEWIDPLREIDFPAFYLTGFDFLFAIAFILGIFTVGLLSGIREEGEADGQEVMDELMSQTRQNLRVLNSVPGLGFVANFPVVSMRPFSHVPGLDVALGVTAHQLSSSLKLTAQTLGQGKETATQLGSRLTGLLGKAREGAEDIGQHTAAVALGAVRWAIQAAGGKTKNERTKLAQEAVGTTMEALGQTSADPKEALRGAAYGAVIGASEAGLDPGEIAAEAVMAARKTAANLGLTEREAILTAAEAAVASTDQLDPVTASKVKEAILQELIKGTKDARADDSQDLPDKS